MGIITCCWAARSLRNEMSRRSNKATRANNQVHEDVINEHVEAMGRTNDSLLPTLL